MRPCIIFNPAARGEKARAFRAFLGSLEGEAVLRPTPGPGGARALARAAVEAGHETIIAAGGDGTVFEVLNGIADAPDGLARASLGVLPFGTANIFAHELAIPASPARAWQALRHATLRTIDAGVAEFHDEAGHPRHAHFVAVAGAGLDARAVQLVDWRMKKRAGKVAYILAAFRALARFPDHPRCDLGGRPVVSRAILVGNGSLYAGDLPVFRGGALDSGRLQVRAVPAVTPGVLVRCLASYLTGRWALEGRLPAASVDELRLECDQPVPLQLDGEFAGWLPARLRVLPGALRVLAPVATPR